MTTAASTLPPTSMMASTTTTTSLELAMSASISVAVERVFTHEYDYDKSLDLALRIKNTSPRAIAAFQTSILVEVTDTLGRDFTRNLLFDCTEAPLAAGEARQAGAVDGDDLATLERRVKATDNCTLGGWDVNQFIRNDVGMYEALLGGNLPRTTVTLNRIVFADGTSLGTAVTGR